MHLSPHCFVGSMRRTDFGETERNWFTEKFEPVSHIRSAVDHADRLSRTQGPARRHLAAREIVGQRKSFRLSEVLNRQTDQRPEIVPALCEGLRFGVVLFIHVGVSLLRSFVNFPAPGTKSPGAAHARRSCRRRAHTRREIAFFGALP